jgi:AcrR family transcriptional regulator
MRSYMLGEPLDMSALAAELGIGRATLYRWVGNREELLARVLAEYTERTLRDAVDAASGEGADLVVDVLRRFMTTVATAEPLATLTQREPLLFIRLAMAPGMVEDRAARSLADLLEREVAARRLSLELPAQVMAGALVRLCDAYLYAHLLGGAEPQIDTTVQLASLLLRTRA